MIIDNFQSIEIIEEIRNFLFGFYFLQLMKKNLILHNDPQSNNKTHRTRNTVFTEYCTVSQESGRAT